MDATCSSPFSASASASDSSSLSATLASLVACVRKLPPPPAEAATALALCADLAAALRPPPAVPPSPKRHATGGALPSEPEALSLASLPPDILVRVVSMLPSVEDMSRLELVSRLFFFGGPPPPKSPVIQAVEQHVKDVGGTVAPPRGWADTRRAWLVFQERRWLASRCCQTVACGFGHTLCIDEEGCLRSCGRAARVLAHM